MELKSQKAVGRISFAKEKERITVIVIACSNGELLLPFVIFKASKPRKKSTKEHPENKVQTFDLETQRTMDRLEVVAIKNYSAWVNNRTMQKFYTPDYTNITHPDSILIFDNHSARVSD